MSRVPFFSTLAAAAAANLVIACGGADQPAKSAQEGQAGEAPGLTAGSGSGGSAASAGSGNTAGSGNSSGSGNTASNGGSGAVSVAGMGCGSTDRGNSFESRPRACVPSATCDALTVKSKFSPTGTPPNIALGSMLDVGPPIQPLIEGQGDTLAMTIDPTNSAVIYAGAESGTNSGLWRTTDAGATWKRLGSGSDNQFDCSTNYLDLPINIAVDPNNPSHLYVTEGVRGANNGFWVSWDAGETWARAYSEDLTAMAVDPCDFCHVIVGSHTQTALGVLETKDGGATWIEHKPPAGANWDGGSYGVGFLYDPKTKQGDGKTWVVHTTSFWRTTDAGTSWKNVSDIAGIHGFTTLYYASDGSVYSGANPYPARSTDNGQTWTANAKGLESGVYYGITGDGTNLYAFKDGFPATGTVMTSPESDGVNWTTYGKGLTAPRGMQHPHFDPNTGIVYFVNNLTMEAFKVK